MEDGSEEAVPPLQSANNARTASASFVVPVWASVAIVQLAFIIFVAAPWYGCADDGCLATRKVSAKVVLDSVGGPYVLSRDGKTLADSLRLLKFPETDLLRNVPRLPGESEYEWPTTAVSWDGKTFAAGYFHGWAQLWSVEDGSLLHSLPVSRSVETYPLISVAGLDFSPDGKTLASVDETGEVRLWSVADGTSLQTLAPDEDTRTSMSLGCYQVAFAPDGKQIAGSLNGTVYVWKVASGSAAYTLPDVCSFVFSPDGKWLATSGKGEPAVTLWNAADGSLHESLNKHKVAKYTGVVITPDSKTLAYMLDTGELSLWDLVQDQEKEVVKLVDTPGDTRGKYNQPLTFTPDGHTLLFKCEIKLCAVDLSQP